MALVLTVLSRLLYGRRKSELSGDAAAFSWMRPVFRLGVGLVGGLPLGMLLYVLVSVGRSGDFSPARLCVCMAVMGIVCYLAAAMLVGKTLRVLPKRLPGAAVTALVLVLLCVVLRADVFGYADRTPQAEDVARARVYCLDTSFTLEDPRSLETLVKAQAELAENRAADANYRMTFEVHYVLKDGTSMARCYRLAMTEPVKAALEQVARLEPDAAAYAAVKDRSAGVELEAHRRAQGVLDQANSQARHLRQQMEQWMTRVGREYDALRTEVEATISHAADQLDKAGKCLEQVSALLSDQDVALEELSRAYDSTAPDKVPAPVPLEEEP